MLSINKTIRSILVTAIVISQVGFASVQTAFADNSTNSQIAPVSGNVAPANLNYIPEMKTADSSNSTDIPPLPAPSAPHQVKSKTNNSSIFPMSVSYTQPSLSAGATSATSIKVNVVFPASGINGNGLYYYDYQAAKWISISNTWSTTNGFYTINNLKPITTYLVGMFWYTDATHSWTEQYKGVTVATLGVAALTIVATNTGTSSIPGLNGHAFIVIQSHSNSNINVGYFSGIAPGTEVTVGTWGSTPEHHGLWYNLEEYGVNKQTMNFSTAATATRQLPQSALNSVNSYILSHDAWSPTNNCSSFAAGLWNSIVSEKVDAGLPNTPTNLMNSILSQGHVVGISLPYTYRVYYANGTGMPILSSVYY